MTQLPSIEKHCPQGLVKKIVTPQTMQRKDRTSIGSKLENPDRRPLIISLAVFLASVLVTGMMVRISEQASLLEQRANLAVQAGNHAHTIQRGVENSLSATYALAALVRQGRGDVADFEATAGQLLPYYPGAASLQLAPDGIVGSIVPLAGNEKAIGHNLLLDPTRDKEAFRARDTGKLTLAGPFNLIQGGDLAVVGRLPVFIDDRTGKSTFWGFTTVLIRVPKVLEEAQLNQLMALGLGYELSRIHPDTGLKQIIASSRSEELQSPVERAIEMPNGTWTLSIAPLNGWGYPVGLTLKVAMALLVSLMLGYLSNLMLKLRSQKQILEVQVARRTAEIAATQTKLQATFDAIPDLIWLTSVQGKYLDCNPMFERFFGAAKADIVGKSNFDLVNQQQAQSFRELDLKVIALASTIYNEEWLTFASDGRHGLFETIRSPMFDDAGLVVGVLSIAHDVTERKKAEMKILRLSQFYSVLSLCNQAIVHCTNEAELFSRICSDVVKSGGMTMVWIALVDTQSQYLRPVASAGKGQEYLDDLLISIDASSAHGCGPEGTAIREQRPVWNQDFMNDPLTEPWHARAAQYAWGSVAALPLQRNGLTIGSFNLYADGTHVFDEEDVRKLLIEMTSDMNYALASFEREKERIQAEKRLCLAANVFTHAREAIMITDVDGTIVEINNSFSRITGYSRDEVLGGNPRILNSGRQGKEHYAAMWRSLIDKGQWYGEIWNRRKNGEIFAEMQTISTVRNAQGKILHYVSQFSDVTALKNHEHELQRIANFDALTGLPNRILLSDRLQQVMTHVQRSGQRLAVVYLDLDGFKVINDVQGHEAGDQLIVGVAENIQTVLRKGDSLARLGSDEFVVVLDDLADIEASGPMLNRLLVAIAQPVQVGEIQLQVSASLGTTFYPQSEDVNPDQLLRQAAQAMYHAKLAGKNRYHVFDDDHDRSLRGHHESLEHIRQALDKGEFVLHYQPKVNMRTGVVIGAEALIRWQHPQRGLLQPGEFLPAIEGHALASEIGEWVISEALTQIESWQAHGLDLPVSVNMGAHQLQQADFVLRLRALLAQHPDVRPGALELEVLETSALEDLAHISKVIEECRLFGVFFALDDFGTGYSSLSYLRRLAVIQLKIDQSFVRDMIDKSEDLAILEAVIGLSTAFHLQVIAEGVETVEQGVLLLKLGCELAQGYFIAHPMPADELSGWVTRWRPDRSWSSHQSTDDLKLISSKP